MIQFEIHVHTSFWTVQGTQKSEEFDVPNLLIAVLSLDANNCES